MPSFMPNSLQKYLRFWTQKNAPLLNRLLERKLILNKRVKTGLIKIDNITSKLVQLYENGEYSATTGFSLSLQLAIIIHAHLRMIKDAKPEQSKPEQSTPEMSSRRFQRKRSDKFFGHSHRRLQRRLETDYKLDAAIDILTRELSRKAVFLVSSEAPNTTE